MVFPLTTQVVSLFLAVLLLDETQLIQYLSGILLADWQVDRKHCCYWRMVTKVGQQRRSVAKPFSADGDGRCRRYRLRPVDNGNCLTYSAAVLKGRIVIC